MIKGTFLPLCTQFASFIQWSFHIGHYVGHIEMIGSWEPEVGKRNRHFFSTFRVSFIAGGPSSTQGRSVCNLTVTTGGIGKYGEYWRKEGAR